MWTRRAFLLLSFASVLSAQQLKSEVDLKADLDRAIHESSGPPVLLAMLALDQFYQGRQIWDRQAEILKQIIYYWSTKIEADSIGVARYSADLAEALERAGDTAGAEQEVCFAIGIFEKSGPTV